MELTQKTKPVIMISLFEIAKTHSILLQHRSKFLKDQSDPLNLILNDLGDPPVIEDDKEMQLTLTSRFGKTVEGSFYSFPFLLFLR